MLTQWQEGLTNLFEDGYFRKLMEDNLPALRKSVEFATKAGVPTPTLSAALNYLESIFNPLSCQLT
jgi:6-phosphogluconate dehydrogenase